MTFLNAVFLVDANGIDLTIVGQRDLFTQAGYETDRSRAES